jgi:uncharacterized repeat protein (TIGR03803 family)
MKKFWMTVLVFAAATLGAGAQTVATVATFDGPTGHEPMGTLIQGLDGNLYGTTQYGGGGAFGNIYQLSPDGELGNLYSFCPKYPDCPNGDVPWGGLVVATNGNYYGTTTGAMQGAHALFGTAYELGPNGNFRTLVLFNGTNGEVAITSLIQGNDGYLYGTDNAAGQHQQGSLFKMTLSGEWTTLYSFCAKLYCTDGALPNQITQGSDGNFYGTTTLGGNGPNCSALYSCGTVFKITPGVGLTTLYNFCSLKNCADGSHPTGNVILAEDGNLYGATDGGGAGQYCVPSTTIYNCGTFFQLTPNGVLTTLYSFCSVGTNCLDGSSAYGGIVEGTDGNFYGTTWQGGGNSGHYCYNGDAGCGTLYSITKTGALTTVYSFCQQSGCADGYRPLGGLMQATNGLIYGTTQYGGDTSYEGGVGAVFSLNAGTTPFVQAVINAGSVGARIIILGNNLRGTSSVNFGGVKANFTVVSATEITATVPRGAHTGWITVTTPDGTLQSRNTFSITQ